MVFLKIMLALRSNFTGDVGFQTVWQVVGESFLSKGACFGGEEEA